MAKNTLDKCRSGKDFRHYAEHHENCRETRQSGSHFIVKGTKPGSAIIPVHNGDLGTGIRQKIIKSLLAIGLGILVPIAFCQLSSLISIIQI